MLADRDYMREPTRSEPIRASTALVIAGVACFVAFNIFADIANKPGLQQLLYLSRDGLAEGKIWQIITFQFLHKDLLHLVLNMFGLYMFGRLAEDRMSQKSFLKLYFVAGLIGGLAQIAAGLVSKGQAGPVLGASAGVYGVIAAFSLLYWHQQFKVLLFFFIPVDMTGQFVFWLTLVSSLIGVGLGAMATVEGPQIAHLAHLGGFFTAFLFVKQGSVHSDFGEWMTHRTEHRREKTMVGAGGAKPSAAWRKPQATVEKELPPEDFISKEVDPILDKISSQGIHSLTEQERKILEKARSKMAKR